MFYSYYYDSSILILLPAILLTLYAQSKVRSTYEKYLRVNSDNGYTGSQVARIILDNNGLGHVNIEMSPGVLSDHYDPRSRVLRLSRDVYMGTAIASNAIAAHEVGHAIQHEVNYMPLKFRNAIVPLVNFATNISWLFIVGGLIISSMRGLLDIGIILFSIAVIFQIVTLPVEFDASSRALDELAHYNIVRPAEVQKCKQVLDAAALTYVAAAASAVSQIIRLLLIRDRRR